jgi:malate dehydrogenase (oxaloacetate-decarboxylating)
LLQWEDFAKNNANRLLERYRDRLCTFNDDIQGTAAVATGTLLSAVAITKTPLPEQKVVIFGAGSAGCGIADLICRAMIEAGLDRNSAARQFYLVDRDGLLVEGMSDLASFQAPFAQPKQTTSGWNVEHHNNIGLLDVIRNVKPTVLIGVSGQFGIFDKTVVEAMSAANERPIIFPLSNPTSRAEATPQDIDNWSGGKAIVGTGSPFPPVIRADVTRNVDQTNNSYIFPGVALGTIAVRARRVSDGMMMAAAKALASLSPAAVEAEGNLLPPVTELRQVSRAVAEAVALQAVAEGLAPKLDAQSVKAKIDELVWTPAYRTYAREVGDLIGGADH